MVYQPDYLKQMRETTPVRHAGRAFSRPGRAPRTARIATSAALLALASVTGFAVGGCGGGGHNSGSVTTTDRSVTVSIPWPASVTRKVNGRLLPISANSVSVTVTDSGGYAETEKVNKPASGTTNATVTFIGLQPGTLQINATAYSGTDETGSTVDTVSASVTLTSDSTGNIQLNFGDVPFHTILVSAAGSTTVTKGGTLALTATGLDTTNLPIAIASGTWVSSNTSVATVSTAGVVTSVNAGTATITFTSASSGLTGTIGISTPGLLDVNIFPGPTDSVPIFSTLQLSAVGDAIGGTKVTSPAGVWTTSNPAAVTVSQTGLATAVGSGAATITFTDSTYGRTNGVALTVPTAAVAAVQLSPSADQTILQQATLQLSVTAYDAGGHQITPTPTGTWSSSDPTVATVSSTGLVTGLQPGQTTIYFVDGAYGKRAGLLFTVKGGDSTVTIQ